MRHPIISEKLSKHLVCELIEYCSSCFWPLNSIMSQKESVLMGDFNVEADETNMKAFYNQYKLKSLIKEPTCFKNVNKPSDIVLFLTNNSKCFEDCLTSETGLPDFHKLIVLVMKTKHERFSLKIVKYRDYKNLILKCLRIDLN